MTDVFANAGHRESYELKNGEQGMILVDIEVTAHPDHKCCVWVEATFSKRVLNSRGAYGAQQSVGKCIAYLIDRSSTKRDSAIFKREVLNTKLEYSELRKVMQTLYNTVGARRPAFKDFADELAVDRILHIDTSKLNANARGAGMGRIALEQFHEGMKRLPKPYAFSGTVLLSPARIREEHYGANDDYDVESGLIAFYEKCGYTLYIRGQRIVEGSLSVMGRTI